MDGMELIGIKEIMALLHCSRPWATHLLSQPDCPTLPRRKGQQYRVRKGAFIAWFENWSA